MTGFPAVKSWQSDLLAQLFQIHSKSSKIILNCEVFPLDFRQSRRRNFLRRFQFLKFGHHLFFWTVLLVAKVPTFLTRNFQIWLQVVSRKLSCVDWIGGSRRTASARTRKKTVASLSRRRPLCVFDGMATDSPEPIRGDDEPSNKNNPAHL